MHSYYLTLITTLDNLLGNLRTVRTNQNSSSDTNKCLTIEAIENYRQILLEQQGFNSIKSTLAAKQHACQSLRNWTELDHADDNDEKSLKEPPDCLILNFFHCHGIKYSEEEELEKMHDWFPKVYQKYIKGEATLQKEIYETAHPILPSIGKQADTTVLKSLENLTKCCNDMHDYIKRIHTDLFLSTNETETILLKLAMKIWKAVRCFRMVTFTSHVVVDILEMATYQVENKCTTNNINNALYDNNNIDEQWPASLCLRDLPIIETITAGVIVIVGLLKSSTPMTRILLTPDMVATKRAFILLDQYYTSISTA
jgi:hypothetical protein